MVEWLNQLNKYLKLDDLQPYICCFINHHHFSIQYAGMHRTRRKSEVSPTENCISKGLAEGSRKTWIQACPSDRLRSEFACPGQVLFFLFSWQMACLALPLLIKEVRMKCYLSSGKIVLDNWTASTFSSPVASIIDPKVFRRYFQCSNIDQEENLQVPCEGKKKIEMTT